MGNQQLTLLQRGVIMRLRQAGHAKLADSAQSAWRSGTRLLDAPESRGIQGEIAIDFERANNQAFGNINIGD